ncbi:hypothetical protein [Solibacillus ferritrahens]|uniref:hypothetical protein n=1 Tax=Solibacillus ferritrahens TaxID=3098620 RepID=UPI00300B677A
MRFALLSLIDVESTQFVSLLIYESDDNGIYNCIAEITKPYELADLIDDLIAYDISELHTDSQSIYRELMSLKYPVIYRREVEGTRQLIEQNKETLIELFELNSEPTVVIPRWRLFVIDKLEKIIQILKTRGLKHNDD